MKVGHVTCDNASNNGTMMKEFAVKLKTTTGKTYNWKKRKIKCVDSQSYHSQLLTKNSCLAHVINLATQMLISTYSKSLHFNPKQPDAHVPTTRDEVGLVRAIIVKVCIGTSCLHPKKLLSLTPGQEHSSSKWKEMWRTIQNKANSMPPLQLILDMKVWWSSTYLMLDHAKRKKNVCSRFWMKIHTHYLFP